MYNIDLTLYTKNDVIKIRYIDKLPHCKLTPLVKDKIDNWISDNLKMKVYYYDVCITPYRQKIAI